MAFKAKNLVVNEKVASSKGGATSTTTTVSTDLPIVLSNTEAKILLESLKNTSVIKAALDVLTIQGQSARKMVNLQDKTDSHIQSLTQGPPKEN